MSRLYLHRSNRLELLATKLAVLMQGAPPADPMAPTIVVVQTPGVARWLSMRLADELGCCMNVDYPYPRGFVEQMLERWLGAPPGQLDETSLTWRIYGLLPNLARDPNFEQVRRYLADGQQIKRLQLAERLAQLFDQYATYRHEMLLGWESGKSPDDWQAQLWRQLVSSDTEPFQHIARVMLQAKTAQPVSDLPERVYIFGVSTLPPLYLQFLQELGRHLEIHLLQLDPTEEYWGDLQAKKTSLRGQLELMLDAPEEEEGAIQQPLLASMGKQGRDFSNLLIANHFEDATPHGEQAFLPAPSTLLGELQNDILQLRDRTAPDAERLPRKDDTVSFAACPSPMREVEELKNYLLHLFEQNPDLRPRDILVLTPDIEKMAPYVEAVFGCPEGENDALPYTIADRGPRGESRLLDAFFAILELPVRRMTSREVLSILEYEAVRLRYELDEPALEQIRDWLDDVRVCWGRDRSHRAELGMGEIEQNSWRAGLDRMLLGIAMRGYNAQLFDGRMPYDEIEGNAVDLAGRLCEAVDLLLGHAKRMETPMPLRAWQVLLEQLTADLLEAPEEENEELRLLRAAIDDLEVWQTQLVDPDEAVDIQVIRRVLEGVLRERRPAGAFLGGRITFAELKPMRSVPARVICMIGMDDGAFPRRDVRLPFDKIAEKPALGDRSQRLGDRYLFLETLLSARERLYISYQGQGKDGGILPPSVCVSELLDYLSLALGGDGNKSPEAEGLLVRHRIHPFSPDYFTGDGPFYSFSHLNWRGATALLGDRIDAPFITQRLQEPEEVADLVTLDDFIRFFISPHEYFLKNTLRLRLPKEEQPLSEDEPDKLIGLESYHVADGLLQKMLQGQTPGETEFKLLQAQGLLPWGEFGKMEFNAELFRAHSLYERIKEHTFGQAPTDCAGELDLQLNDTRRLRLRFNIGNLFGDGRLVRWKMGDLKAKDRLKTWLSWLTLCAYENATPERAVLIGAKEALEVSPSPSARETLTQLGRYFVRGAVEPLPFFPETGYAAMLKAHKEGDLAVAYDAAEKEWKRDYTYGGGKHERDHLAMQIVYRDGDPFLHPDKLLVHARLGRFLEISRDVWMPYLKTVSAQDSKQ